MATISRSALVPFSAQKVFDVVNDIEAYPLYMEGCVGATVLRREWQIVEARLELAKSGIKQSFTTRNRLLEPEQIIMELVEGPFSHFEGRWSFHALQEQACKVSLDLHFTMSNRVVGMAARKLFESVSNKQVDALCQRVKALHG